MRPSLVEGETIALNRNGMGTDPIVYVLRADRKLRYPWGKSRIAYIGTTKVGLKRVASSVADRAEVILGRWGVRSLQAHLVRCSRRQNVRSWKKLERAMLLVFREVHGSVPVANKQGKGIRTDDEWVYFRREKIQSIIEDLS